MRGVSSENQEAINRKWLHIYLVSLNMYFRLLVASLLWGGVALNAQNNVWSLGAKIAFHCARLNITSGSAPSRSSTIQTTPAFGLYLRVRENKPNIFEFQLAYELTGSNKELYYERRAQEWVRIYDHYRTAAASAMLYHHLLNPEGRVLLGIGLKGQYVVNYTVRHPNPLPVGSAGLIYTPGVQKFYPSACMEFLFNAGFVDVGLGAGYGLMPLIRSEGVKVVSMTAAITVKKRFISG